MKVRSLKETKHGWFVSGFPDVIHKENFEVAIKKYKAGDKEKSHFHKKSTEITVIISGKVLMNSLTYEQDDIIIIEPGESTDFLALEDTISVVVKNKYIEGGDKYVDEI